MSNISGMQRKVLSFIIEYKTKTKGETPTKALIAAKFGWESEQAVETHILGLIKKGYVLSKSISKRSRELIVLKNPDGTEYKGLPVYPEKKCRSKLLTDLQDALPWTIYYHKDFKSNPQPHKDFAHAALHIQKALGKIASVINDAEHGGHDFNRKSLDIYVADLVICALRMANTCPSGKFDLQEAVIQRLEDKNQIRFVYESLQISFPSPMAN